MLFSSSSLSAIRVVICISKVMGSEVKVTQSCPTLSNPMYHTVCGILQTRILKWVAISNSRGSFQPRDQTQVSVFLTS